MNEANHINCALSVVSTIESHHFPLISREEITKKLRQQNRNYPGHILSAACRELLRGNVLEREGRVYRINLPRLGASRRKLEHFSGERIDIAKVKEILRPHGILTRREINDLLSMYTVLQVDQILPVLQRQDFIRKLKDVKSRGRYIVMARGGMDPLVSNPIDACTAIFGRSVVFCYHTALEIHGLSRYGMSFEIYVHGAVPRVPPPLGKFRVRNVTLRAPRTGIMEFNRAGTPILLTDAEKTIIDCVRHWKYAVGWENILYALNKVEPLDGERILSYLKAIRIPSLFARMGVILEHYQDRWNISPQLLNRLGMYCPTSPVRFSRDDPGRFNRRWNMYVPEGLFETM